MPGSELLARQPVHPSDAKRILLIDYSDQRMLRGHRPRDGTGPRGVLPDQAVAAPPTLLYPVVGEALAAWTRLNSPGFALVRIVGDHWDPVSFELRDDG